MGLPERPTRCGVYSKYVNALGELHARSYYPLKPAIAESLFVVLDSTIDSVRIANTIRAINREPERWGDIFEQLERTMRESASKVGSEGNRSEKPGG